MGHLLTPEPHPAKWVFIVGCYNSGTTLLETLLRNLISNALRYTRAGSVEMLCARHGTPPPQAIIADYRLRDGKTGVQAIARLREHFGADIPALIITGDTAPNRLIEADASGHTLMHKPVQPGKLRAYLSNIRHRN